MLSSFIISKQDPLHCSSIAKMINSAVLTKLAITPITLRTFLLRKAQAHLCIRGNSIPFLVAQSFVSAQCGKFVFVTPKDHGFQIFKSTTKKGTCKIH